MERDTAMASFDDLSSKEQVEHVKNLLGTMNQFQHGDINAFLQPLLKRDFITLLPTYGLDHIARQILTYLDPQSLLNAELVSDEWRRVISDEMIWKNLIERQILNNIIWRGLAERGNFMQYLFVTKPGVKRPSHSFYRSLYPRMVEVYQTMKSNWRHGLYSLRKIDCQSEENKGVYCIQYDNKKIVSGLRDHTVKFWDIETLQCTKVLTGHHGSVLCLEYNDEVLVTGSSDSTLKFWDINTGELIYNIEHHNEAVLHLKFDNNMLVVSSKDWSISVWDVALPGEVKLRKVLMGHRAAVNVVDFDHKYIVSGSGDRNIKVWNAITCKFEQTLSGHKRGVSCIHYKGNLIASGSSDCTIRLWDVEWALCIRVLKGHSNLVRCIRFDSKRLITGCYGGRIKIWDLPAALDPDTPSSALCLHTFRQHTGKVFRIQFDEFQIVSSSVDDSILIWDFFDATAEPITNLPNPPVADEQNVAAEQQ